MSARNKGKKEAGINEKQFVERARIRRSILGWHLIPANPTDHPLVARLYGVVESAVVPAGDLKVPVTDESLKVALQLVCEIARDWSVHVRVCGNMRQEPTLLFWERPKLTLEAPVQVFGSAGLTTEAARWSISDFSDEHKAALAAVLETGRPFDTGWYSVTKEIQAGRISRHTRNGPVLIEVSAEMDERAALVDDALWQAAGKESGAGDGIEVLTRLGLSEQEALAWSHSIAETTAVASILSKQARLAHNIGYEALCDRLERLMQDCESELESGFDGLVELCRQEVRALQGERSASKKGRSGERSDK